eukprot:412996_1
MAANLALSKRTRLMTMLSICCVALSEVFVATEDAITKLSLHLNGSQMLITTSLFTAVISIIGWLFLFVNKKNADKMNEDGAWYGSKQYLLPLWLYSFCMFLEVISMWYGIRMVPLGSFYLIITFA